MSQPIPYVPVHSFIADSATVPNFPGQALDVEFAAIEATTDEIRDNLAEIQRDDGALANSSVGYDQLSASLQTAGLAPADPWLTATAYVVGDTVISSNTLYRCLVSHTSGVFATDLAAADWTLITVLPAGSGVVNAIAHGVGVATSATVMGSTAALTNGQLVVGQTGADPLPKTISGDVTFSAAGVATLNKSQVYAWGGIHTFAVAPVFTDGAGTRTALGLGTSAVLDTGTSGAKVARTDGANVWSASQQITGVLAIGMTVASMQANMLAGFKGAGNGTLFIGQDPGLTDYAGLWSTTGTPTGANYMFIADSTGADKVLYFNSPFAAGSVRFQVNALTQVTIDTSALTAAVGIKSTSASAGVGYATGAGGAITQGTSRTTTVILDKVSGAITLFAAAGSATAASFTVTNAQVAATDTISLSVKSGTNKYLANVTAVAAGSFEITFNTTGGTASDSPVINFNVIKGVAA